MKTIRNSFGKLNKNAKITLFGVPVSIFTLCFCCFAFLVFVAMVQPREFKLQKPDYVGEYSTDQNEAVISFTCNKIDSVEVNDSKLSNSDFKLICGDGLKVNLNEGENIFKVTPNDPDNEKAKERTIKITYATKEEAPAVSASQISIGGHIMWL